MKNVVLGITLAIASTLSNANNSKFEKHVIDYANSNGFMGCEQKIKSAFEQMREDDSFKVNLARFADLQKDSLRVTATYGAFGDSLYQEAHFRKSLGKCFVFRTTIITSKNSCMEYARFNKAFENKGDVVDFSWMANNGGVPLYLKPLNGGCIAILQTDDY